MMNVNLFLREGMRIKLELGSGYNPKRTADNSRSESELEFLNQLRIGDLHKTLTEPGDI